MSDGIEPDGHIFSHRYVSSNREDNRIATCSLDSTEEHDIAGDVEPFYNTETIREEIDQVKKEMTLDLDDENSENWNATVRKFAENLKQSFDKDTSSKSDDGGEK